MVIVHRVLVSLYVHASASPENSCKTNALNESSECERVVISKYH